MHLRFRSTLSRLSYRILASGLRHDFCARPTTHDAVASRQFSVIVPVHDSLGVVTHCFASLRAHALLAEIVVVDDGSRRPETIEFCRRECQSNGWILIRHETPHGHSQASAAGVARSSRPLLCLLNSDTIVPPSTWHPIQECFAADPRVAVVGPSTCDAHTHQCIEAVKPRRFDWDDAQIQHFASRYTRCWRAFGAVSQRRWSITSLRHLGGFAFFIRRAVWNEFGGFEARLKDYFNETELCFRIAKRGYRLIWTREAYVHHLAEQSYGAERSDEVARRKAEAEKVFAELHGAL